MGKLKSYSNSKLKATHLNSSKKHFLGFGHICNYVPPTLGHLRQALPTPPIASQGHDGWGPFSVPPAGARQKTGSAVSQNLTLPGMPPPASSHLEGNLSENENGGVPALGEATGKPRNQRRKNLLHDYFLLVDLQKKKSGTVKHEILLGQ